jgi:hypothetical protein
MHVLPIFVSAFGFFLVSDAFVGVTFSLWTYSVFHVFGSDGRQVTPWIIYLLWLSRVAASGESSVMTPKIFAASVLHAIGFVASHVFASESRNSRLAFKLVAVALLSLDAFYFSVLSKDRFLSHGLSVVAFVATCRIERSKVEGARLLRISHALFAPWFMAAALVIVSGVVSKVGREAEMQTEIGREKRDRTELHHHNQKKKEEESWRKRTMRLIEARLSPHSNPL